VPTGGWRTLLVALIIIVVGVVIHEFGYRWLSKYVKNQIEKKLGPDVFGTEVEVGSLLIRPWTGVFIMKDFVIKNPPGYSGEYMLKAAEVSILTAPKKILFSLGKTVQILFIRFEHIDVHIEFPGLVGSSNYAVVREHINDSHQKYLDKQAILKQGKKPSWIALLAERELEDLMDHAVLLQAEFVDIHAIAHHPLLSGELNINDIEFDNFSKDYDAVGVRSIASHLADAFYQEIQKDAMGETGAKFANVTSAPMSKSASHMSITPETPSVSQWQCQRGNPEP